MNQKTKISSLIGSSTNWHQPIKNRLETVWFVFVASQSQKRLRIVVPIAFSSNTIFTNCAGALICLSWPWQVSPNHRRAFEESSKHLFFHWFGDPGSILVLFERFHHDSLGVLEVSRGLLGLVVGPVSREIWMTKFLAQLLELLEQARLGHARNLGRPVNNTEPSSRVKLSCQGIECVGGASDGLFWTIDCTQGEIGNRRCPPTAKTTTLVQFSFI